VLSLRQAGLPSAVGTSINDVRRALQSGASMLRILATCSWSQYCDNTEVILSNAADIGKHEDCYETKAIAGAAGYEVHYCRESMRHVLDAAVSAQMAYLTSAYGWDSSAAADAASRAIPEKYSANDPLDATADSDLNIESKVLRFGPFNPTSHFERRGFSAWGPAIVHVGGRPELEQTTLSFGPAVQVFDPENPDGFWRRCNVEGRFGLASWTGNSVSAPLDALTGTLICYPMTPKLGRSYNIDFRVNAGFQGLWDGPSRRNLLAGAGIGFELPFGRYVAELAVVRNEHWSSSLGTMRGTSISLNVHIPSINLSDKREKRR
jgi:hypothetical protein